MIFPPKITKFRQTTVFFLLPYPEDNVFVNSAKMCFINQTGMLNQSRVEFKLLKCFQRLLGYFKIGINLHQEDVLSEK